jgi:hypothetical protein
MPKAVFCNPAAEMDLRLWDMAERCIEDDLAREQIWMFTAVQLASRYSAGGLAPVLQQGLSDFLAAFARNLADGISRGIIRWLDNPAPVFVKLASYIQYIEAEMAQMAMPDVPDIGEPLGEQTMIRLERVKGIEPSS